MLQRRYLSASKDAAIVTESTCDSNMYSSSIPLLHNMANGLSSPLSSLLAPSSSAVLLPLTPPRCAAASQTLAKCNFFASISASKICPLSVNFRVFNRSHKHVRTGFGISGTKGSCKVCSRVTGTPIVEGGGKASVSRWGDCAGSRSSRLEGFGGSIGTAGISDSFLSHSRKGKVE